MNGFREWPLPAYTQANVHTNEQTDKGSINFFHKLKFDKSNVHSTGMGLEIIFFQSIWRSESIKPTPLFPHFNSLFVLGILSIDSIIFYWSAAFRICTGCLPKYEWNLLKIGFKNTYFQVFQGFPALRESSTHPAKWPIFTRFWSKWPKRWKLSKKRLEHFSCTYKP